MVLVRNRRSVSIRAIHIKCGDQSECTVFDGVECSGFTECCGAIEAEAKAAVCSAASEMRRNKDEATKRLKQYSRRISTFKTEINGKHKTMDAVTAQQAQNRQSETCHASKIQCTQEKDRDIVTGRKDGSKRIQSFYFDEEAPRFSKSTRTTQTTTREILPGEPTCDPPLTLTVRIFAYLTVYLTLTLHSLEGAVSVNRDVMAQDWQKKFTAMGVEGDKKGW